MLKKDSDRIKSAAKKQKALQQSLLNVAIEKHSTATVSSPSPSYVVVPKASSGPRFWVWGTAILIVALIII